MDYRLLVKIPLVDPIICIANIANKTYQKKLLKPILEANCIPIPNIVTTSPTRAPLYAQIDDHVSYDDPSDQVP